MKLQKTISVLTLLLLALLAALMIGIYQNLQNSPIRNCKQFETNTEYRGYTCPGDRTIFIPPQK